MTGVWPFNCIIFTEEDFLPSSTTHQLQMETPSNSANLPQKDINISNIAEITVSVSHLSSRNYAKALETITDKNVMVINNGRGISTADEDDHRHSLGIFNCRTIMLRI